MFKDNKQIYNYMDPIQENFIKKIYNNDKNDTQAENRFFTAEEWFERKYNGESLEEIKKSIRPEILETTNDEELKELIDKHKPKEKRIEGKQLEIDF